MAAKVEVKPWGSVRDKYALSEGGESIKRILARWEAYAIFAVSYATLGAGKG